jgi:phosphohistidine phosphatase
MGKFRWSDTRDIRSRPSFAMLTLTLIRHAKSSWSAHDADGAPLSDSERPLAPRGLAAGPIIAAWLGAHVDRPDAVLASTAARTRATWALLAGAWGPPPPCAFDDALYMASADGLLRQIGKSPATTAHLMIVGHNPGLQDLALASMRSGSTADRLALMVKFPTAGVVVLTFDAFRWSDARRGEGHLQHFVSPRRLAEAGSIPD